jgi:hypothetical protein
MLKQEHSIVLERFEAMQPWFSPDNDAAAEPSVIKLQLEAAHNTIAALRADVSQHQRRNHELTEVRFSICEGCPVCMHRCWMLMAVLDGRHAYRVLQASAARL